MCFLLCNFSLILNIFLPYFAAIPAYATDTNSLNSHIEYSSTSNKLNITTNSSEKIEYQLFYKSADKIDAVAGTDLVATNQSEAFYLGTCSANSFCLPQDVSRGVLKIKSSANQIFSQSFALENNTLTIAKEGNSSQFDLSDEENNFLSPWTYENVVPNKEYEASGVKLTFTKLPEPSGNIKIEEITLTQDQIKQTGSLSNKAYDITSDMVDGSFAYNLSLPIPESSKGKSVDIKFAEEISQIDSAQKVDNTTNSTDTSVSVTNLDHFTVFVVVYDALPSVSNTNYPSLGFQATQTSEFGDYVHLGGSNRLLNSVTVTMSDWAKYSDYSSDVLYSSNSTSWSHPITINIYSAELNPDGTPKTILGTVTQNITIPWRPESSSECGTAWKSSDGNCYNGLAFNAVFDMSGLNLILPDDIIVGVAYNTNTWGQSPIGLNGPYESLNVAVPDNQPVTVGNDDNVNEVFWNTVTKAWYTDGGAAGFGVFRKDTNWTPNGTVAFKIETIDTTPACNSSSFDTFELGSVNSQGGWSSTGSYDQAIVSNSYGFDSFGCKTLRLSNGVASGSFGDQTFSYSNTNEAGETLATNGGQSSGTRQNHFEAQFDFASTQTAQQSGLSISVSPDRGDGSRMSYLRFVDDTDGIDVFFDDVSGTTSPVNFVENRVADNLSRTTTHSAKFVIDFVDGPSNDIVKIYIDGSLVETGTTWENYYRYDTEASAEQGPRTTDNLLFRAGGSSVPANNGKGFLFDNISLSSSTIDTTAPQINNLKYYKNGKLVTTPSTIPIFVKSINDLTYGADYQDNSELNRTAFVIWDATDTWGPVSNSHKCNWNGSPSTTILNSTTSQTLSGIPLKQCNPSYSWLSGKYIIIHIVYDNAGNSSYNTDGSQRFIIDTTAPVKPTGLKFQNTARTQDYSCGTVIKLQPVTPDWNDITDDPSFSHFEYTSFQSNGSIGLNEQTFTASEFPNTWMPPADGAYGYAVRSVDLAGNKSDWALSDKTLAGSCQIIYDSIPPTITVNPFITNDTTPKITGTINDSSAVISVKVDGKSYTINNNGSTWELADNTITPALADGTYDVVATATDAAGNIGTDLTTNELTVDSIAPTAMFQHYIDDVLFTDPIAYTNDLNKLTFTAEYRDFTPSSGLLKDSYVIFDAQIDHSFKFSQNGAKSYCGWRTEPNLVTGLSGNNFPLTTPEPFTNCIANLTDGEYYMTHQVYDNAVRQDIPSITQFRDILGLHFIIDSVKPSSEISLPTNNGTNSVIYSSSWDGVIAGTATDSASGINKVQLTIQNSANEYWTGSAWQVGETLIAAAGTTNWTYQIGGLLTDGTYTIKSHAIDNAGNTENTYTLTIVLDKTIPQVSISLNPVNPDASNGWYKTQPEIILTAAESTDKIEYQWDSQVDGSWTEYSTPFKLTNEGAHVLYYRAIDLANNISNIGAKNISWDQTDLEYGPQNISANPNPTSGSTSKIKWDFAKDNTGIDKYEVQWSLNGTNHSQSVGAGTTEVEIDDLTEGTWNVKVIAFDHSGRTKDASINVTVDRSGPIAPVLTLAGTGVGTATLSWNAVSDANDYIIWYGNAPGSRLYGARVGNVTSYTVRGLGAGNYYFIIKAVDAAQNQGSESNEVNTGTIAGAANVEPNTPAQGFTPEVLGATTTENITPTPTLTPSVSNVLGVSTGNIMQWWWLWLLLLIPMYFILRRLFKNNRNN